LAGYEGPAAQPPVRRPLRLADAIYLDMAVAIDWYERRLPGLGETFLKNVERTLQRIEQFPESYQIQFGNYRSAVVRRFPHGVFYRVMPDAAEIVAIFDCRMAPATIHARLGD
jgi:hypothetical protein